MFFIWVNCSDFSRRIIYKGSGHKEIKVESAFSDTSCLCTYSRSYALGYLNDKHLLDSRYVVACEVELK